jgi:hypothetical protein
MRVAFCPFLLQRRWASSNMGTQPWQDTLHLRPPTHA